MRGGGGRVLGPVAGMRGCRGEALGRGRTPRGGGVGNQSLRADLTSGSVVSSSRAWQFST